MSRCAAQIAESNQVMHQFRGRPAEQPKYVALVSGLGVSETGRDDMMRLSLLVDWLSGMLGGPLDQERASQARPPCVV